MTVETRTAQAVENADVDRTTAEPEIRVESRRPTLHDFLKTAIKINGSDIHLQAGSIPMIRVDGKARFLEIPPASDEAMREYVDQIINRQQDPADKRHILEHKGAVDVAYPFENIARFRTNIFHSRERYAIVMRRIVTKIPQFEELNLPPVIEKMAEYHRGMVIVSGTTGFDYATMSIADSLQAQTEQCLANIEAALRQAGASLADVVRVTYVLPDASEFEQCWPVLRRCFGTVRPAAMMISAGLADPRMKIEIEVTAVKQGA